MGIVLAATVLAELMPGLLANISTPVFRIAEYGALANFLLPVDHLIVIGGMPGIGKSSFLFQVLGDFLRLNIDCRALVANAEMTPAELMTREVSRISGVYLGLDHPELSSEEVSRVKACKATLESYASRLAILPMPFTLRDICTAIEAFSPTLVVVDYLQCIDAGDGVLEGNERLRMNRVMSKLRELASGRVIIVVSALKRTSTNYDPAGLGLDSFRETGGIEYGCNFGFIMVPNKDAVPQDNEQHIILRHLKSRGTEKSDIHLKFDGRLHRWTGADDASGIMIPETKVAQGVSQESSGANTKAEIMNLFANHQLRKAANESE